jgi:hypothetical protein
MCEDASREFNTYKENMNWRQSDVVQNSISSCQQAPHSITQIGEVKMDRFDWNTGIETETRLSSSFNGFCPCTEIAMCLWVQVHKIQFKVVLFYLEGILQTSFISLQ